MIGKSVTLNNGVVMPTLGLGVWQMREGAETENAVRAALDCGYRMIDTARLYGNERSLGRAVRASGIPREQIFVTTKLFPTGFFDPEKAFETSFARLDIGYIDLYLIHNPVNLLPGFRGLRTRAWHVLEKLLASGRVRAIGISNYSIANIEEVLAAGKIVPAVNQVLFNPFAYKAALLDYCKSKNIVVQAYSPLTRAKRLNHPVIRKIADARGRSPAQVLIRWALQHGTVVIPKSSNPVRIAANTQVFDFALTDGEMTELDGLTA
ncbi:MAG TPA: aldo/keto reductase [Micropepsaceae bacterium]|nr:aldo/keto reductase [Micropepsaceae bacterium]